MKRVFTLALVMAIAITSFAQVKSIKRKDLKDLQPTKTMQFKGMEEHNANLPASNKSIITAPEETELGMTSYDWQTNHAARNFTAVWPDGYAVMCYTQSTTANYSNRGTGLAIWDPAVGEWEFTEQRVENTKTGFGSIARYKENGLVIAAHTSNDMKLFFCEDFRNGSRDFSQKVDIVDDYVTAWPVVQCSGENLDIVHILATVDEDYATILPPVSSAILYYRYENGAFTVEHELIEPLDENHMGGAGSNLTYFLPYNPEKPNRVAFDLNCPWSDGKIVISEDDGATWTERVFYQHPGIFETYENAFLYPRWVSAEFDDNDNINLVYEWNGSSGEPGSGGYYAGLGGISFWSETLPKNEMCIGGIGNVGEPFIMDSSYIKNDIYSSEWYWSDALHDPLPEYFGELMIIDRNTYDVIPYNEVDLSNLPEDYLFIDTDMTDHGGYNSGIAAFPSMHMDGDRIFAFWSMIAGDCATTFFDGSLCYYRLFGSMSTDGGLTWSMPVHLITDIVSMYDEMVYGQIIPYVYSDAQGEYLWLCYQNDQETGTYVQDDDSTWDNNYYRAVKVYVDYFANGEEENTMTVAPMINVYPNPAQGSFNVALNNYSNVNIYNTVGQLVKTYNNVRELNVNLESGVYFVNAGNETVKVIVK